MGDPLAERLNQMHRSIELLNARVQTLETRTEGGEERVDRFRDTFRIHLDASGRFTHEAKKAIDTLTARLIEMAEAVQVLEHAVFPGATPDKVRLQEILGAKITPSANPLDRRRPDSKEGEQD